MNNELLFFDADGIERFRCPRLDFFSIGIKEASGDWTITGFRASWNMDEFNPIEPSVPVRAGWTMVVQRLHSVDPDDREVIRFGAHDQSMTAFLESYRELNPYAHILYTCY